VDCLVCHDTTGTYKKVPTDCGHPAYKEKTVEGKVFEPVNLAHVAQNVGRPSRRNCGSCHFFGGGGDGIKHGDLDSSLLSPDKALDVHMDAKGLNYTCTACHTTKEHRISGRTYTVPAPGERVLALPKDDGHRLKCESCHGPRPHKNSEKLDNHTDRVACVTCHVPAFARGKPTGVRWDWSTAGRFDGQGKPFIRKDDRGLPVYNTKKGEMTWEKDGLPVYRWYDGSLRYSRIEDRIDPEKIVHLNSPAGDPADSNSRISPFKILSGRQPFDTESNRLVIPKLVGPKGSGAYWGDFDWTRAISAGMQDAGLEFSGNTGFVETIFYRPLNHAVAPKEKALVCVECHSNKGRLAGVSGIYIPGRDSSPTLDRAGIFIVAASMLGALCHGLLRVLARRRLKR